MKLIYKNYVIEREEDMDEGNNWSVTDVRQYIEARDDSNYEMEWTFFFSLSDAKTYIDIIESNNQK